MRSAHLSGIYSAIDSEQQKVDAVMQDKRISSMANTGSSKFLVVRPIIKEEANATQRDINTAMPFYCKFVVLFLWEK